MLLQVIRTGNHYDYVKDFMLDSLIESKGIVKFKRITGWVTLGVDPIRRSKRNCAVSDTDKKSPA
jgi:hypothetical protein